MANNQVNRLLEFANMQMAAEAFLLRDGDGGVLPGSAALIERLKEGNTHASKFTPGQATKFTDDYQVLAQHNK
ncbi:MAG: hypothetical protein H7X76_04970 [Prolixibacteraceae bacterium]|nr:hypothetical protein [Burkholderiales bacterium]